MSKTTKDTRSNAAFSIASFVLALVVGLLLGGLGMREYLDREDA